MIEMPPASAQAHAAPRGPVELRLGPRTVTVDPAEAGPSPLELMAGTPASCSAFSARTHLQRDGDVGDIDVGDIEVVVTLDAGPPTLLYRRVLLPYRLGPGDAHRLVEALERTELTMMLRPAFGIRTQIEHAGKRLN